MQVSPNSLSEVTTMRKMFLLFLFLLGFSSAALAVDFSAESVMTNKGGEKTFKVYVKTDRMRMEQKDPQMIIITRLDKKVVWNVMPKDKIYMETAIPQQKTSFSEEKVEGETERKLVGTETIQGHPTKKYLITYTKGNKTDQVYQWWATDIQFPIRVSALDGSWKQEYRNIKKGAQPDSLFEVPAGFQKIQMPAGAVPPPR